MTSGARRGRAFSSRAAGPVEMNRSGNYQTQRECNCSLWTVVYLGRFESAMVRRFASLFLFVLSQVAGVAAPPNLVLITIDTLRADRLGCYGYSKAETPNLDR